MDLYEQLVLNEMLSAIGNKPCIRHHGQGFQQPEIIKSYYAKELEFTKMVLVISKSDGPPNTNVVSSKTTKK